MSPWSYLEDAQPESWGMFVRHAFACGADIQWVEPHKFTDGDFDGCWYLVYRAADGEFNFYALPRYCEPTTTMRYRTMLVVCKRLKIPKPPHWPATM
jgi:hypothetical protein